uniref:uridine diphosphate glucose pyrophosphatase NUDT14 n=1 Tax=Myxine glutinosa TaxID=7769 RepID=UPI00358EE0A6
MVSVASDSKHIQTTVYKRYEEEEKILPVGGESPFGGICAMEKISEVSVVPCTESKYLRPFRVFYSQFTCSGNGSYIYSNVYKQIRVVKTCCWMCVYCTFNNRTQVKILAVTVHYKVGYLCQFKIKKFFLPIDNYIFLYTLNSLIYSPTCCFFLFFFSVMVLIYNTSCCCFVFVKQFRPAVYMKEMELHKKASAVANNSCSGSCVDGCPFSGQADLIPPEGTISRPDPAKNSGTSRESWKPSSPGVTLELCAGILDKDLCAMETASQEVLEECGYAVPAKALRRVASFRGGVGVSGGRMTMFYAEVTDNMRVPGAGGGCADEGEYIITVEVPVAQAASLLDDRDSDDDLCGGPFVAISLSYALLWFDKNIVPLSFNQPSVH